MAGGLLVAGKPAVNRRERESKRKPACGLLDKDVYVRLETSLR